MQIEHDQLSVAPPLNKAALGGFVARIGKTTLIIYLYV